ncbi:MAG: type III secretion system cytoplasmic ring protein SctQ [Alphaproteobacteria bacterium]
MDHATHLMEDDVPKALGAQTTARVRAYRPPAVDPKQLALANRLSLRRPPVAVSLGDTALAFTPIGLDTLDALGPPAARVLFWFTIDGRPLVLQMPRELFERLLARIDPELLAADIDREILPLLLESCVEEGLGTAEADLGSRIELVAVQPGAAFDLEGLDVALEVALDGEKAGFAALRAARKDVERLADRLAARDKPARSYGDLRIELSLRAGSIWLDLGELKALDIGDVLLVEDDPSRWERMAATAGERWMFPVEMTRKGPTALAPFRRAGPRDREEWMMVEPSPVDDADETLSDRPKATKGSERPEADADLDAGPVSPPADAVFDELPIKLVFELGRIELPLGQLQEIGPGHVFQLDRTLGEAVEIHAGGRRIGQGQIVQIDEQIGVRVVRLFGQRGA